MQHCCIKLFCLCLGFPWQQNNHRDTSFLKETLSVLTFTWLPDSRIVYSKHDTMIDKTKMDVLIIGGSYAGRSAAMALGRALRNVLVIDGGKPCNRQTPHSHNFLTHDGETPRAIAEKAKEQVLAYDTVKFLDDVVIGVHPTENGFEASTQAGDVFRAKKLLFATGVTDIMPAIPGFAECWGISVLHCPYCHGYEVRQQNIGLLANGDLGFELARLISQWTGDLTLYTNGASTLTPEQASLLKKHHIHTVEKEVARVEHSAGKMENLVFTDGTKTPVSALFARVGFKQHCMLPQQLGCELTEQGYIRVDDFQKTNIHGVFAAGDNTTMFRAVSAAVAAGTKAGALINKELIDEVF